MIDNQTLDRVKAAQAARTSKANADFVALVNDAAGRRPVDEQAAAQVIDAAGKTPEDFEKAVNEIRRRGDLRALVKIGSDAARRIEALKVAQAELNAELDAAQVAHEEKSQPIRAARATYTNAIIRADQARAELLQQDAQVQETARELERLNDALRTNRQSREHAAGQIAQCKAREHDARELRGREVDYGREIEIARRRLDELERERAALADAITDTENRLKAAETAAVNGAE